MSLIRFCTAPLCCSTAVKTRDFDSYTKCMFVCFCLCWIISPVGARQTFLAVYLQKRQHKVLRVKLERRLGWHRDTSCTNREKLPGFTFTLHRWKMEKRSWLGRQNGLFFSAEKSFQNLGSPQRSKRCCLCVGQSFIVCRFNTEVRKYYQEKEKQREMWSIQSGLLVSPLGRFSPKHHKETSREDNLPSAKTSTAARCVQERRRESKEAGWTEPDTTRHVQVKQNGLEHLSRQNTTSTAASNWTCFTFKKKFHWKRK